MTDVLYSNYGFDMLSFDEQQEVQGGGVLVILGAIVVGIVVDEVVERTTGKDVSGWLGTGLNTAGNFISSVGEKLAN